MFHCKSACSIDPSSELTFCRDIVDTEPFMGNVYKMLLGSFNEGWDNPEKKSPSIQSSASLPFPSDPDLRFHKETTGGD